MPPVRKNERSPSGAKQKKETRVKGRDADPKLEKLSKLVKILEESTLIELSYEDEDMSVGLKRQSDQTAAPTVHVVPQALSAQGGTTQNANGAAPTGGAPEETEDSGLFILRSPFVGTFYRAPSPDTPVFADVGQRVTEGQALCIVEAMKLMNEIQSEVDGEIAAILVENGSAVQYGDPLFKIATS